MKIIIICVLCVCILMLIFSIYWSYSRETYKNNTEQLLISFFKQIGIDKKNWKLQKQEEFNNGMSFCHVELDNGRLFFTIETYPHRQELRLLKMDNLNNEEWKRKLEKHSFYSSTV